MNLEQELTTKLQAVESKIQAGEQLSESEMELLLLTSLIEEEGEK